MSIQKEKWYVQSKKADFKAVGEKYGIDQVTARIIRNRDIIEDADIAKYSASRSFGSVFTASDERYGQTDRNFA